MIQNALSSTHGSKDPECACFGELGLNNEAKASRFEPNLSLSIEYCFRGCFLSWKQFS